MIEGPYALFGYSHGALIAFEVCRCSAASGYADGAFVSGCRAVTA